MTEAGIIQIVTLILACIGPILTLWVKSKLTDVHKELNSRLDEYKKDLVTKSDAAEMAAMARGLAQGIETERQRAVAQREQMAKDVLATAKQVAEQVILVAADVKKNKEP